MASSGSKSVSVTAYDTLRFSWSQVSQSVANNTTKVSWTLQLVAGSSGRISSTASKAWSVTVNGTNYSGSNTVGISNNATKTLASGSTTIAHTADGSKSFNYSFSQEFGITFSGKSVGTVSGSGSGTLNTIPRATTPTLSASSVNMGSAVTISTPRASGSFTHDLAYSFGGSSYTSIATGVGTSYSWTVPDLASRIPNATSGTLTVRCVTKNGSTTVGTKTVTMTAKVPSSVVPTISAVALAETVSGLAAQFGAFVKSKSKPRATITAAGAKGSTIKTYSSTLLGKTYKGASWTADTLTSAGTLSIVTTVTDSRGRTAKKTTTLTVQDYGPPKIQQLSAYRLGDDGEDPQGTRLALRAQYSVSSVGDKNTASAVVAYKLHSATTWTTLATYSAALTVNTTYTYTTPTFSADAQYDIRLTLTDWFGTSVVYTATLPTAEVILDIKADGKGLAFGKVAEFPGIDLGWDLVGASAAAGAGVLRLGGICLQWGGVNITPTAAGTPTTEIVTFDVPYTATPTVFATPVSSVPHQLSVAVQRATDLVGDNRQKVAITLTREGTTTTGINWLAIGPV
jgi:hypothetical protein